MLIRHKHVHLQMLHDIILTNRSCAQAQVPSNNSRLHTHTCSTLKLLTSLLKSELWLPLHLTCVLTQCRTEGWLDLKCRAEMALSAVNGLAYLHEMSIVHFDLKPDNLLLDGKLQQGYDGSVPSLKVADFGLSKQKWGREFVSGVRDLR